MTKKNDEITAEELAATIAEAQRPVLEALTNLAEAVKGLSRPAGIGDFARQYWAENGKAPPTSNAEAAADDVSDLVPKPVTYDSAWEHFHGSAEESKRAAAKRARDVN